MKQRGPLLLLLSLVVLVSAVWMYMAIAMPQTRTLDQRVNDVAMQIKCPVCQNESVASSSASIAEQMRLVIRQQLQAGRSEQQVLDYFAHSYGNQILLTPQPQGINLLAWLVPAVILLLGLGLLAYVLYNWRTQAQQEQAEPQDIKRESLTIDPELEPYRVQLERELAQDDLLPG